MPTTRRTLLALGLGGGVGLLAAGGRRLFGADPMTKASAPPTTPLSANGLPSFWEASGTDVSKKVTHTVNRAPRITKLSAAVLVDGVDGKPRAEAEIRRLSDLAKSAMGYDAQRGDAFDISSAPFAKTAEQGSGPTPFWARPEIQSTGKTAALLIAAGAFVIFLFLKMGKATAGSGSNASSGVALLKPGSSVAELEAMLSRRGLAPIPVPGGDGAGGLRDRARELSKADPARAAHLLRAWIASDTEAKEKTARV